MARKVMISCAVTGSADTPGKNPAVPVTPEQIANSCLDAAKAGAAIVHIHVRDPKTTKPSMDKALYRETVERIRAEELRRPDQPDHRPGRALLPRRQGPVEAQRGFGAARAGRARAARHGAQARDLQPRHGQPQHGRPRLHQHADAPQGDGAGHQGRRRDAGARSVRDRPPAARQALPRERLREGPGHVPDLPRHLLGPAGHARSDDLYAQPAAARTAPGSRSASRSGSSRWWRRRCCSAAIRASAWRTTSIWRRASSRRATRRWSRRPARSSRFSATRSRRRPTRGQMLGVGANA